METGKRRQELFPKRRQQSRYPAHCHCQPDCGAPAGQIEGFCNRTSALCPAHSGKPARQPSAACGRSSAPRGSVSVGPWKPLSSRCRLAAPTSATTSA
jgi:hypothetical protein